MMARTTKKRRRRLGVATVELAVALPAFIAITFGAIEICQRLYIKQSTIIAAYEACRVATRPISGTADVTARCQLLLDQQEVKGTTIQVRNITQGQNNLDGVVTGDEIRVRIDVDWAPNVVSRYVIGDSGSFRVQAFMLRE